MTNEMDDGVVPVKLISADGDGPDSIRAAAATAVHDPPPAPVTPSSVGSLVAAPPTTAIGPSAPSAPNSPNAPNHAPNHAPTPAPNQAGVITPGPIGNGVVFLSDEQAHADVMEEDHALPAVLLCVCVAVTLLISASGAMSTGGVLGVAFAAVITVIGLGLGALLGSGLAWVIGKMFGEDYGSFGPLMLRVSAVYATHGLAVTGMSMVITPIFALFIGFPIFILLSAWLIGMDLLQAIVFSVAISVTSVLLTMFLLMSMAASVLG